MHVQRWPRFSILPFVVPDRRTRRPRARAFAALLFVVSVLPVAGQSFFATGRPPRFNLISRADGLPNNAVSSIFQDERGLIWMGTQAGIVRYDGVTFVDYHNEPFAPTSLPHDLVQTTYYDAQTDTVWIGTYAGLARWRPETDDFETLRHDPDDPASLSDNVVIAISRGPDGAIWAGTQNGLNRLREDDTFELIPTRSAVIRDLFLDSGGTLWVGSLAGLDRWDPETESLVAMPGLDETPYVMSIAEREPGVLLLGTWAAAEYGGGVIAYRPDEGPLWRREFSTNSIYTVLAGSDGTIWAGSWGGGLFAIAADGVAYEFTPETEDALADPVIYALFEDAAGRVWVGTNGGGVHILSPRQRDYRAYYHDADDPESLPAGRVTSILRDSRGTLWVGTYGGGLGRLDADDGGWTRFTTGTEASSLANNIVNVVYEDSRGDVWVGTNGGLQRFVSATETFEPWSDAYPAAPLGDSIVYEITEDREGRYWIGTYRNGVTRFDPQTGTAVYLRGDEGAVADDLIYDIAVGEDGTIWIATNGGLTRVDPRSDATTIYRYDALDRTGISGNTVRAVRVARDGLVWLGTLGGGISILDQATGAFSHITEEHGLPTNRVASLLEDDSGAIWAGTQEGLVAIAPGSRAITVYNERDGLYGSEFNAGALRDSDGALLFGGAHGITRIDAAVGAINPTPPFLHITDVALYRESIDPGRLTFNDASLEFGPDAGLIGFSFAALDYEPSARRAYRYRLHGFDETWIDAGSRSYATYTNLPAGTYRLEVHAANADGVWTQEPAQLEFTIGRVWYLQWWAIAAYVVLGFLLTLTIVRAREAIILGEKNRQLADTVEQLEVANVELERLSTHDSLTGCHNRRFFDRAFREEWDRARRAGTPLHLLMIDVDHFKPYNDTYGHVAGDRALRRVADRIVGSLARRIDIVARYGGEEFIVLLFGAAEAGALEVAERIRAAVAADQGDPDAPGVTVSVGVAGTVPADADAEALIRASDAALYDAKHAGRNRVAVARS